MGATAIFSIITVAIFAQSTFAFEDLRGKTSQYNSLCTSVENHLAVGLPTNLCDLIRYIVCWKREAIFLLECPKGFRFDNDHGWCDLEGNIPLPSGCTEQEKPNAPTTCEENGPGYMAHPSTCKKYIWCVQGGYNYTLPCPKLSYFIPRLGTFVYVTEAFRNQMLDSEYDDCSRKDPYTIDEIEGRTTTRRV